MEIEGKKCRRKEIAIEKLFLHPENTRFAAGIEHQDIGFDTDKQAIERMFKLSDVHMDKLLKDVAENGLIESLLPIVYPIDENRFLVYDANRRITIIKLLVVYKEVVDEFEIPSGIKSLVKQLDFPFETTFLCAVSENKSYINSLLRRIHTNDPGVAQVNWTPEAKDFQLAQEDIYTNCYLFYRLLSCSKHSNDDIKKD
ncbi:MAG: hypothetical protein ACRCUV_05715 [Eubacterium aggregans]